jgi:hypothetical protein
MWLWSFCGFVPPGSKSVGNNTSLRTVQYSGILLSVILWMSIDVSEKE